MSTIALSALDPDTKLMYLIKSPICMLIIAHFLLKALSSSYMIMRYAIHEA